MLEIKDLEYALEFHASNFVYWHQERMVTLHPEYDRVNFHKDQHFIVSKIDYNKDLYCQGGKLSSLQKGTQLRQVTEQEKQVYHAFDLVDPNKRSFVNEGETDE